MSLLDQARLPRPVNLNVAAEDDMFRHVFHLNYGHRGHSLVTYFRCGLTASRTVAEIFRWRFPAPLAPLPVLDFASGYGRCSRFLCGELAAGQLGGQRGSLWVSDVKRSAVAFQRAQFGVRGFESFVEPAELVLPERFSAIVVLSLLSHLPEHRFVGWLHRLWDLLAEEAVLILSVHDASLNPRAAVDARGGIHFEPTSEMDDLAATEYGSTWVSQPFVARVVEALAPAPSACLRWPRGLWHHQDLYAVVKGRSPSSALDLYREPEAYLERCSWLSPAEIRLEGWAVSHAASGSSPLVRVLVNGQPVGETRATLERADLARNLGASYSASGFLLTCAPPARHRGENYFRPDDVVHLIAEEDPGENVTGALRARSSFHVSFLEGADLLMAASRALDTSSCLERKMQAMERSAFWRARERWFRLKGRLGLG